MITVQAPITVNQFDEERYTRTEQAVTDIRTAVRAMREQLQEVLTSRQAEVDAAAAQLKKQNDALEQVVKTITEQQQQKG